MDELFLTLFCFDDRVWWNVYEENLISLNAFEFALEDCWRSEVVDTDFSRVYPFGVLCYATSPWKIRTIKASRFINQENSQRQIWAPNAADKAYRGLVHLSVRRLSSCGAWAPFSIRSSVSGTREWRFKSIVSFVWFDGTISRQWKSWSTVICFSGSESWNEPLSFFWAWSRLRKFFANWHKSTVPIQVAKNGGRNIAHRSPISWKEIGSRAGMLHLVDHQQMRKVRWIKSLILIGISREENVWSKERTE